MNAPLLYCAKKRGYVYEQEYSLPRYFLSEMEKGILQAMAEDYFRIGSYGYDRYNDYAGILSKMAGGREKSEPSSVREPYIAEIKFLDERKSVVPLDFFFCQRRGDDTAEYAFYDPDIFMSVLFGSGLKFRVLRPKWFKAYLKNRLTDILSAL